MAAPVSDPKSNLSGGSAKDQPRTHQKLLFLCRFLQVEVAHTELRALRRSLISPALQSGLHLTGRKAQTGICTSQDHPCSEMAGCSTN